MKRVCPKCGNDEVWARGGMKRYVCKKCLHYFDNDEWAKEDNRVKNIVVPKEYPEDDTEIGYDPNPNAEADRLWEAR